MQLLVRNKVKDFATWMQYFDVEAVAAAEYGVTLDRVWQTLDDPNNVFFVLNVESVDRANDFMARPESAEVGEKSGVVDGEFWYIEPVART